MPSDMRHTSRVIVYALTTARSSLAVDLYLTREAAEADLTDALRDEPDWHSTLSVVPVELHVSTD